MRAVAVLVVLATALGCRRPTHEAIEKVVETKDVGAEADAETGSDAGPRPDARLIVDGKRLLAFGLTMVDVRAALGAAKITVIPAKGASVEELYLRLGSASLTDVTKAEIAKVSGVPVRIGDVATLEMVPGGYW